ncbi:MAG: DUF2089 domain-containing protein [Chloroflexi bacterium]|nr:DUF2089 domain-containing protein [Chloroflexota bacterium]
MIPLPSQCPFGGGEIVVTRFYCPDSGLTVEGQFSVVAPFAQLAPEQLKFVEIFVRCEGKLSRMEDELKLSYPTIRTRLHEVIRALGYEPGKEEPSGVSEDKRKSVLQALDEGQLSFEEAMQMLQGGD